MIKLYLLVGLLFIGVFILKLFLDKTGKSEQKEASYKKKQYFFTVAERSFYDVLKQVAQEANLELFAKVRLADILYCNSPKSEWITGWNKIKSKHVDFLLCDKENYTPVVAIELDDLSHDREEARYRDTTKTKALEAGGIKLVRIPTQAGYDKEKIRGVIWER